MAGDRAIQDGWRRLASGVTDRSQAAPSAPPATEPSRAPRTFISSGAIFEGSLSLKGDFHIDTEYRGSLETDGKISVGPNGSVVGNIRAREVLIQGAVVGNVIAPRQLVVEASGKLHGDIETACLEIQKYAFFQGRTTMTQPQAILRQREAEEAAPPTAPALHA
jgi:cytoskeletal protein CcmA (bactofilin family)